MAKWHLSLGASLALTTTVAGCADADPAVDSALVSAPASAVIGRSQSASLALTEWEGDAVSAEQDAAAWGPFPPCQTNVPALEDGLVEFDTAICSSYSVQAPLPTSIQAGSVIEFALMHTVLLANEPAMGRMVLRLNGEEFDRWEAAIPGPADARTTYWSVSRDIPAGALLGLHVSNHGANNWRLASVRVFPPP